MKQLLILVILMSSMQLIAQSSENSDSLMFWLGKWEVTWNEGTDSIGSGINDIHYNIDRSVIQEKFQILTGKSKGYKGTSISVFNIGEKRWNQAWADNRGSFYSFHESRDSSGHFCFQTNKVQQGDQFIISRMRFTEIETDTLLWIWEKSSDGGMSWVESWVINYRRIVE